MRKLLFHLFTIINCNYLLKSEIITIFALLKQNIS